MKHGHRFAIGLLALTLAACGGGGSDHSSSSSTVATTRVEVVRTGTDANTIYRYQDPLSIQTGDTLQFQLVRYTNGVRTVLDVEEWTSDDTVGQFGSIARLSGFFTAASTDSNSKRFVANARFEGKNYSAFYRVNPRQIRVIGRVLANDANGTTVDGAVIDVYGPSNAADVSSAIVPLATGVTAINGTFRISVPAFNDALADGTTASPLYFTVRFQDSTTPSRSTFFNSFHFRGDQFDTNTTACLAPLTDANGNALISGERFLIDDANTDAGTNGTILLAPRTGDQPGATGCIDVTSTSQG